jgi:hypothetical protein
MTDYITTYRHQDDNATSINSVKNVRDVDNEISLLEPNDYSLLTLLRKLRKEKATDQKVEWFEDVFPEQTVTATVGDSDSGSGTFTVSTADASLMRQFDLWLVSETGEVILIESITSGVVTSLRNVGGTDPTVTTTNDMSSGDTLFYIGNAQPTGARARPMLTTVADEKENYCQIFKEAIGVSNSAATTKWYGGPEMVFLRRKHGILFQRDIERGLWCGKKGLIDAGDTSEITEGAIYTMGGVQEWLPDSTTTNFLDHSTSTSLTEDDLNDFLGDAFRYGNKVKFHFSSPYPLNVINSWGRDKIRTVPRETTFGLSIMRYVSAFGELNLVLNNLFYDLNNTNTPDFDFYKASFILDMENLKYCTKRDTQLEQNIQENDRDAVKDQYIAEVSMKLKQPKTHAVIEGWVI